MPVHTKEANDCGVQARAPCWDHEAVKDLLNRVFLEAPKIRVFGERADALLSRAMRADIDMLQGEDKVRLSFDTAIFDVDLINGALAHSYSDGAGLKNAALSGLHELIHVWQGIDAKRSVVHLRNGSFEDGLRQLDLGADHAAAVILSRVTSARILTLKDIQSRAVLEFPVTAAHVPAAANRKRDRFLSLRADIDVGRRFHGGRLEEIAKRYVYVDLSDKRAIAIFEVRGVGRLLRKATLLQPQFLTLCNVFGEVGSRNDPTGAVDRLFSEIFVSDQEAPLT